MARRIVRAPVRKRKTLWLAFTQLATTLTGDNSALVSTLNAAALALRPFTVVRTHFAFYLLSDQAAAVETQACMFGTAVVSDQATDVGISAVPLPEQDIGSSLWFSHKIMWGNETSLTDRTVGGAYFDLDSKAMRKVEVGSDIAVVVENPLPTGLILQMAGRMLIKTN